MSTFAKFRRASSKLLAHFWWWPVLVISAAIQTAATVRAFMRPFPPALDVDAAFFQHAGWYMAQGAIPYIHIWDQAPPIAFYLTSFMALLSNQQTLVLHWLAVVSTGTLAVLTAVLLAWLIEAETSDRGASIGGALVVYSFVYFYNLPTLGFGFKHFSLFFGMLALWLALIHRPFLSGSTAAIAAGIWSLAVIFVLVSASLVWRRMSARALLAFCSGAVLILAVALLPLLHWRAVRPMLEQTLLIPLQVAHEEQPLLSRLGRVLEFLKLTSVFVPLAVFAMVRAMRRGQARIWWVMAGLAFFSVQILFIDFDNFPDLFPLLAFTALGVGVFLAQVSHRTQRIVTVGILAILFIAPLLHLQTQETQTRSSTAEPPQVRGYEMPRVQTIYWEEIRPATCHYRLSESERTWLEFMAEQNRDVGCPGFNPGNSSGNSYQAAAVSYSR